RRGRRRRAHAELCPDDAAIGIICEAVLGSARLVLELLNGSVVEVVVVVTALRDRSAPCASNLPVQDIDDTPAVFVMVKPRRYVVPRLALGNPVPNKLIVGERNRPSEEDPLDSVQALDLERERLIRRRKR